MKHQTADKNNMYDEKTAQPKRSWLITYQSTEFHLPVHQIIEHISM